MSSMPNVVIVVGRCSQTKEGLGIRFEELSPGKWVANWCFAIKEASAKREGYNNTRISGTFEFADGYPGCPHCGVGSFVRCGCDKLGCWDGESPTFTCPFCNASGEVTGSVDNLSAGGDR